MALICRACKQERGFTLKRRPEYDMKLIGRNLMHLRKAKGFSVEEVREYLCLGSVQAVYKYEKGKSYPPADTLLALMELYGAELKDIIGRHEAVLAGGMKKQQVARLMRYHQLVMERAG